MGDFMESSIGDAACMHAHAIPSFDCCSQQNDENCDRDNKEIDWACGCLIR